MADKIAFGHPGRLGDALYCLPTIKYLCNRYGVKADFWTSEYCLPLKDLFEYQDYIDRLYVSPSYKLRDWGCGGQPPFVPIPTSEYEVTYQLGFRNTPDKRLDWFIGESVGIDGNSLPEVSYEYPPLHKGILILPDDETKFLDTENPYIVIAPRGETGYKETFRQTAELSLSRNIGVVYIGRRGEADTFPGFDCTGLDLLYTTSILSRAIGFVGLMSSQLVLANGFPDMIKVAPQDGKSWDMRHVVYSDTNYYPVDPTAQTILDLILGKG
jgi:hypothetical protein